MVKINGEKSEILPILSGVPQGSVLGPILYMLFTADIPTSEHTLIATFADDTAIISAHANPIIASHRPQVKIRKIQE